jgi:hypothetical protein
MNTKKLNQPAQIADPYRPVVLAFLREYVEHEIQTLRNQFGIELDPAKLPTSDDDYLRLPVAESCRKFALVAAGQTQGLKKPETRAQVQGLLHALFSVPGATDYEMPPIFWLSDFGNMVLLAMAWAMDIELITVTQAVELTGRPHDYFTHAVQRGKLTTYPDIREPNPTKRSRLDKAQVLALGKK